MIIDLWLFHLLNDFVGVMPALDWFARALVNDHAVPTTAALVAVGVWFAGATDEERTRNRRAVILVAMGVLFTNALIRDLAHVYFRPRPFAVEPVNLLFYRPSVSSFPSVPIATVFCFAWGIRLAHKQLGNALALLGGLYALARVYAGVHYPSDVVAGALLAIGITSLIAHLKFFFEPIQDWLIRIMGRLKLV